MNLKDQLHMNAVLDKAREVYGNNNQIMVCIEELNELACVLAKFPRYDSEQMAREDLHQKALDEVADVEIILNHVKAIMNISQTELELRKLAKVARVERWLNSSSSMQQTIEDRTVETN